MGRSEFLLEAGALFDDSVVSGGPIFVQIRGDVETVLDSRGALLLGLGLGAAAGIVSFLFGLIRRTDRR